MKVIIIGGVAGGASAAARLRRLDETAEIILLERGEYISYANCGLPYFIGGAITEQKKLTLQTPAKFNSRFGIDVRVGQEAVSIDRAAKTVTVRRVGTGETYTESYDKLILSPGAEPVKPRWTAVDDPRVVTLRSIPDTLHIRRMVEESGAKNAVVVGGGYIGVEMAENFTEAGLRVTLIELADHVIAPLDYDMACGVHQYLREQGVDLRLGVGVQDLKAAENGIEVVLPDGSITAGLVLLSIGVRPESSLAREAGLDLNPKGAIRVDEQMRTSDPDIYAVGDAVEIRNLVTGQPGYIPLAGPANKQGRIAADNICGIPSVYKGTQGSAVAKLFDLTIATTGLNEGAAKAAGIDYDKVYAFPPSHATYYPGASDIALKVLFDKADGRVLGAQLVGFDGVDKRCDVLAAAIRGGLTMEDLTELELCYAPPFSSAKDPVNMAGFIGENVRAGLVHQFFWDEVEELQKRDDVILLDVSYPQEYAAHHIEGAVSIPLDELRSRMNELDRSREICLNCKTGLRSYVACRILMQNGFRCRNLAGGYQLYSMVACDRAYNSTGHHPCGVAIQ